MHSHPPWSSNVSIQQNPFALSKPSHSYPYAAASQYRLLELHDCQLDEIRMTIPPGVLVVTLGTIHENNKRFSGPWSMEWSFELSAGGRYCPKNVDRDQRKREAAQYKC
ncbi:hypothetical protein ALC57_17006 [Trachymyrmex cornetzi]|uniref:Uncharacterized protein n=1 Tax=Trachymyrmex cornetzi TaxID=471704 RepID=A0A195DD51_9HYME|nr:hypothetical protein ALC57_17006 [Trachymyrmex cornetzi]